MTTIPANSVREESCVNNGHEDTEMDDMAAFLQTLTQEFVQNGQVKVVEGRTCYLGPNKGVYAMNRRDDPRYPIWLSSRGSIRRNHPVECWYIDLPNDDFARVFPDGTLEDSFGIQACPEDEVCTHMHILLAYLRSSRPV